MTNPGLMVGCFDFCGFRLQLMETHAKLDMHGHSISAVERTAESLSQEITKFRGMLKAVEGSRQSSPSVLLPHVPIDKQLDPARTQQYKEVRPRQATGINGQALHRLLTTMNDKRCACVCMHTWFALTHLSHMLRQRLC